MVGRRTRIKILDSNESTYIVISKLLNRLFQYIIMQTEFIELQISIYIFLKGFSFIDKFETGF